MGLRVDRLQHVSLSLGGIRVEMVSSDWLGSSVSALEVRVLVHLGGAQRVSSVDRRSTDVGLVCELGLVLAMVQGGRGQHAVAHANRHLVYDAWWVAGVLDCVTGRTLRRDQVGHRAGGAQGCGGSVGVEMWLPGQMRSSQVGMNVSCVGGAVVEGVLSMGGHSGGDVGLLPPVTSVAFNCHVLLGLNEGISPYYLCG